MSRTGRSGARGSGTARVHRRDHSGDAVEWEWYRGGLACVGCLSPGVSRSHARGASWRRSRWARLRRSRRREGTGHFGAPTSRDAGARARGRGPDDRRGVDGGIGPHPGAGVTVFGAVREWYRARRPLWSVFPSRRSAAIVALAALAWLLPGSIGVSIGAALLVGVFAALVFDYVRLPRRHDVSARR